MVQATLALSDLRAWYPVACLAEAVKAALAGEEGLSPQTLHRLRLWASRWQALSPELRDAYAATAHEEAAVARCLRWLLEAHPPVLRPDGAVYGIAKRALIDAGMREQVNFLPRI